MVTIYNPAGTLTAKNVRVLVLPTPHNVDNNGELTTTIELLNTGFAVECAIDSFETTTDLQTQSRRKLCDNESKEYISGRTRKISATTFSDDKNDWSQLGAILKEDAKIGLAIRRNIPHGQEIAAGDEWTLFNATVASVDPAASTNADGEESGWVVNWSEVTRTLDYRLTA